MDNIAFDKVKNTIFKKYTETERAGMVVIDPKLV